jgi:hypothetical protein
VAGTGTGGRGGTGVYGTSTDGDGIVGSSADGADIAWPLPGFNGHIGVSGTDNSTEPKGGYGVYGSSVDGSGVCGTSPGGTGVTGISTEGWGVEGITYSENGLGVFGGAYNMGCPGVQGFGDGDNSFGVWAEAIGSGALAVFASGDVTVTGSLSKGGGSFRIDHPLDPANKYLYHSFVESPDMMNVYNGTVLDADGRAVVGLADWFEALNRDYRYQLTPIGGPAPDLHIAAEVSGGQFAIAGGTAGQKVSWQVTGIRQDAWANAHRIPVEETKPAEDQGRYLHPELHHGEPISSIARVRANAERHRTARPAGGTRP